MRELHFVTHGRRGDTPVVFLHGFMGSGSDWIETAERLGNGYYALCVDLPGHGQSVGFADPRAYTMQGAAELIIELFTKEDIDRAHIVGYSMGGRTALYFAVHHPACCRKLVLESASPGLPSEADRMERRGRDEAQAQMLETGELLEFLEEWYRQPLFHTYRERPDLLRRMIETRSRNDPRELARSLRGMGTGRQPSLWDHLEEIRLPVVAIAGALDGKFVETARRMAVLMPNVRTAIIPDAGHNLHAERPAAFADIVRDFLTKPT